MAILRKAGIHPRHDQVLALRKFAEVITRQVEADARRARKQDREWLLEMLRQFASDRFAPDVGGLEEGTEKRIRREVGRHLKWMRRLIRVLTFEQRVILARFIEEHAGATDAEPPHETGWPVTFPEPEPRDPEPDPRSSR